MVEMLVSLNKPIGINLRDLDEGQTAMMIAAENGDVSVSKLYKEGMLVLFLTQSEGY